jgi:hypothetical protein
MEPVIPQLNAQIMEVQLVAIVLLGLEYVASLYIVLPQQQFLKTVHIFKILISPLHMHQLVP